MLKLINMRLYSWYIGWMLQCLWRDWIISPCQSPKTDQLKAAFLLYCKWNSGKLGRPLTHHWTGAVRFFGPYLIINVTSIFGIFADMWLHCPRIWLTSSPRPTLAGWRVCRLLRLQELGLPVLHQLQVRISFISKLGIVKKGHKFGSKLEYFRKYSSLGPNFSTFTKVLKFKLYKCTQVWAQTCDPF